METLYSAVFYVLGKIAESISGIEETYRGTKSVRARSIRDVFRNKTVNYTDPHDGGIGISQNDPSVKSDWKIDLTTEEWFVYTDNYGTYQLLLGSPRDGYTSLPDIIQTAKTDGQYL